MGDQPGGKMKSCEWPLRPVSTQKEGWKRQPIFRKHPVGSAWERFGGTALFQLFYSLKFGNCDELSPVTLCIQPVSCKKHLRWYLSEGDKCKSVHLKSKFLAQGPNFVRPQWVKWRQREDPQQKLISLFDAFKGKPNPYPYGMSLEYFLHFFSNVIHSFIFVQISFLHYLQLNAECLLWEFQWPSLMSLSACGTFHSALPPPASLVQSMRAEPETMGARCTVG